MRILERYVLREHLFPFFIGFSVVVFLLTLDFLFDLVDLAIGKGISAGIVLELFALSMGLYSRNRGPTFSHWAIRRWRH